MDYEQKYKQALERAKGLLEGMKEGNYNALEDDIIDIFPELTESEDERIRKAIKKALQVRCDGSRIISDEPVTLEEAIAWLEKQGEHKPFDYENANIQQKDFALKVKPKFKVGDWILNDVCFPMQIASIKDGMYIFTEGDAMSVSFVDEHLHLWSIQDAEDGDVLINWNNTTFIFRAIEDETVKFHIAYNEKWDTIKTPSTKLSHLGLPEPQFEFHPAAKEQRDLLFSKMKEAGYEWDSKKKELKKIK